MILHPSDTFGLTQSRIVLFVTLAHHSMRIIRLQHHSSKASIFLLSAFLSVQLSHAYMKIGKTMALNKTDLCCSAIYTNAIHTNAIIFQFYQYYLSPIILLKFILSTNSVKKNAPSFIILSFIFLIFVILVESLFIQFDNSKN